MLEPARPLPPALVSGFDLISPAGMIQQSVRVALIVEIGENAGNRLVFVHR